MLSLKDAVDDDASKKTNEEPTNKSKRNGQEKEGGASNKEDDQNVQDFRAELDNVLPLASSESLECLDTFANLKTDAGHDDVTQETTYDQVKDDAHALRSYTTEFKKEAQAEKKRYIDLIEKLVKDIINNEVKTQLPQILLKAVSEFTTPMIKSTITESLEDVVLAKSSS
ncbi:hypothetical protein Tco_0117975 [Tanacetum coccineum]